MKCIKSLFLSLSLSLCSIVVLNLDNVRCFTLLHTILVALTNPHHKFKATVSGAINCTNIALVWLVIFDSLRSNHVGAFIMHPCTAHSTSTDHYFNDKFLDEFRSDFIYRDYDSGYNDEIQ